MRAVRIRLAGRERYLCFTVEAMFQLQEMFGGVSELLALINSNSRESFTAACRVAAVLAEQGELARRYMGYEPEDLCGPEAIAATTVPSEIAALKLAIPSAISLGYGREITPENDEVDLGLAELNEQKKTR